MSSRDLDRYSNHAFLFVSDDLNDIRCEEMIPLFAEYKTYKYDHDSFISREIKSIALLISIGKLDYYTGIRIILFYKYNKVIRYCSKVLKPSVNIPYSDSDSILFWNLFISDLDDNEDTVLDYNNTKDFRYKELSRKHTITKKRKFSIYYDICISTKLYTKEEMNKNYSKYCDIEYIKCDDINKLFDSRRSFIKYLSPFFEYVAINNLDIENSLI